MSLNKENNHNYQEKEIENMINSLLDDVSNLSLNFFNSELEIKNKGGDKYDPVSNADVAIEKMIRKEIKKKFLNLSICGEEIESKVIDKDPYIVIDPIDGTKSFISGVPTWSTLVGFNNGKKLIIGFADLPLLNERYIGLPEGSFLIKNKIKKKISTSRKTDLSNSVLSCTDPVTMFAEDLDVIKKVENSVSFSRYGLDAYAYCLLSSGLIDVVIDSDLKIYDIQPLIPIIRSAGGYIATWEDEDPINGGKIIAASTKELFLQTQRILLG